ncbi:hypothetical protein BUALT_Bualt04G0067000 [Buddleja alternifolia]|uniref:Cupin type-1 domain-containing protein n=1 Tax=Buddleja alternifolia TaxID=168488 RepID=A0AAV6XXQ0_9LAMI|nr:hypothetical protein BUALT_Bualt04G0067000 [Buddleja alternifolia]
MVFADDFFFPGLNIPGNTSNPLGSRVATVNVNQLPGLNTLCISVVRIDYAPYGLNPPHTHPRATEVLLVLEGTLYVGFVTSNPADPNKKNKLFTKYLNCGDIFVFPEGVITIANAVFGSYPSINQAVLTEAFQVEKKICKNPNMVVAHDFFFPGLNIAGNTSNPLGSMVTTVNVNQLPGLNTLGISVVRIDYAPYGLNPPHTHPRATDVLLVLEGTLYVGFVTSNPADPNKKSKLFTKYLNCGDVFVFPEGLILFLFNVGHKNAVAFAGLSSKNPEVITIANAVFGSYPSINQAVLTKAFQVEKKVIDYLQAQF